MDSLIFANLMMNDERLEKYITLIKNVNMAIGRGSEFTNTIDKEIAEIVKEISQEKDNCSEKSSPKNRNMFQDELKLGFRMFESMFRNVYQENNRDRGYDSQAKSSWIGSISISNTPLQFIYEYNKCNIYAKIIMCISKYSFGTLNARNDAYCNMFRDENKSIENAQKLARFCKKSTNKKDWYKFIFWSLMILTVDKTDATEHLSLVCDFAAIFHITEDEFEDILRIVKIIYSRKEPHDFITENVPNIFENILKKTNRRTSTYGK